MSATALLSLLLASGPMTLADLEALAGQKAWGELLEKAEKVAPAQRTPRWNELVTAAAVGVVSAGRVDAKPFDGARRADALAERFGFLREQAAYARARGLVVAQGIEQCLQDERGDGDPCWKVEGDYEKSLTGAPALAAARAFVKARAVRYRPMALFAAAARGDTAVCGDGDFVAAVVAALELPPSAGPAQAAVSVLEPCWKALEPALKAAFSGKSDAWLENVCPTMRARHALSEFQQELCDDATKKP